MAINLKPLFRNNFGSQLRLWNVGSFNVFRTISTRAVKSKKTDIILLETTEHVGVKGQAVSVSKGFARNYLLPYKKAILFSDENRQKIPLPSVIRSIFSTTKSF